MLVTRFMLTVTHTGSSKPKDFIPNSGLDQRPDTVHLEILMLTIKGDMYNI